MTWKNIYKVSAVFIGATRNSQKGTSFGKYSMSFAKYSMSFAQKSALLGSPVFIGVSEEMAVKTSGLNNLYKETWPNGLHIGKLQIDLQFRSLIHTLASPKCRLHLGNKNKCEFILYFARFALPLTLVEGTFARPLDEQSETLATKGTQE